MVKSVLKFGSLVVAIGLSTPALGYAQAIPKTTGSSSSGSSSGSTTGTSSGSSSGGSTGSSSGGSGGGGVSQPPSGSSGGSSSSSSGSVRTPSSKSSGSGSSSTVASRGKSTDRPAPVPGGVATGTVGTAVPSRLGTTVASGAPGSGGGRDRGASPVTGQAVARSEHGFTSDLVAFPFFGPWGRWYPWYTGGFGWNAGFLGFNPWDYAATCWSFGRYGTWYDPYSYCWDPYSNANYYGSSSAPRTSSAPRVRETMGNLRIKANVSTAKVYIDDALAGLVDEFDGLNEHIELLGGPHKIEIRAEGYKTFTKNIKLDVGRTQTVRASLKKQ